MIIFDVIIAMILSGISVEAQLRPMINITDCGRVYAGRERILGGRAISIERMPWMVGIGTAYGSMVPDVSCTGFIVSKYNAITAALCISFYLGEELMLYGLKISFGSNEWLRGTVWPITGAVRVEDVAIVNVAHPFEFGPRISPICIAENFPSDNKKYKVVQVGGFGETARGQRGGKLHRATSKIHKPCECKQTKHIRGVREGEICVGKSNIGPCHTDLGGPLMVEEKGIFYAVGVLVYTAGCPTRKSDKAYYWPLSHLVPELPNNIYNCKL